MSLPKPMVLCVSMLLALTCAAQTTANAPSQTASPSIAGAQNVQTGGTRVHGTISDPDGELIPGATITLTPAKGSAVKATSGSDGTYTTTVAPGAYTILVSMPGFASYVMTNLR